MKHFQTEVLVIGGGATGAGVVRDLAMRGFKTVLVEKGDLAYGTTGRYHGLLHSGGRYVVKDPLAAKECIEENRILRQIMSFCIEDTGGFFVVTPWDDPDYAPRFVHGCQAASIPVEEISISQMLQEEPLLNPNISRCFRVPDASADSFLAADANADSARQYGASIFSYHKVIKLMNAPGSQVTGALCHDLVKDDDVQIDADLVVNAAGAWAGIIAGSVGIPVQIIPGKGTMLAINHRILNTVVNRCKMPSDGDIIVPAHTVAVIGTTDVPVDDPDHFAIEAWEVKLMLEEGEKLVPELKEMRILRAWAGVRPLYKETSVTDTREVTRAYVLLDHEERDGMKGLVTITSGKWTTYRKMAEATVDLVCGKLGVHRACRTHLEVLPGKHVGYHSLGARLAEIEKAKTFGELVCECELATLKDVEQAIATRQAKTIDDVRRDVRLGMGPCQGGFCTYRVAGILHKLAHPSVEATNVALRDFLQERWKGLLPILWGQQLRQEYLDELIYLSVLNADHLPGPRFSRLGPELYTQGSKEAREEQGSVGASETFESKSPLRNTVAPHPGAPTSPTPITPAPMLDVLILGAGLAGLAAGWQATARGKKARVIAKGWGALYWNAGCIDVLGYEPNHSTKPLASPTDGIARLIQDQPHHPYSLAGLETIQEAISKFQSLCAEAGYPMLGSLEQNWLLPSAVGAFRPTCLAPETMVAGDLRKSDPTLIVGFKQFPDFYPDLIADNLNAQNIPTSAITLDLPILQERRFVTGRVLSGLFESVEFRVAVVEALKTRLAGAMRVGFPAVLGLDHSIQVWRDLQERLRLPVFEIPTLPPSIPGIRLHRILVSAIERQGGRVFDGMQAVSAIKEGNRLSAILTEAAARQKANRAKMFVLATGGILGGGLKANYDGSVQEIVIGLPVSAPINRQNWLETEFLSEKGHPIFRSGLQTDTHSQPIDSGGNVIFENLYAVGATLTHADFLGERSLEGVGLVTGFLVGKNIE